VLSTQARKTNIGIHLWETSRSQKLGKINSKSKSDKENRAGLKKKLKIRRMLPLKSLRADAASDTRPTGP